jgi:hypothetical protein
MPPTSRELGRLAQYWARTRDTPEVLVMGAMVLMGLSAAAYTAGRTLISSHNGSAFWNVNTRGACLWKQALQQLLVSCLRSTAL